MIRSSSKVFHNDQTASQKYTNLDEFKKSASLGKVKSLSSFTHELRLIKSPAELKLMRESASIACQVLLCDNCVYTLETQCYLDNELFLFSGSSENNATFKRVS